MRPRPQERPDERGLTLTELMVTLAMFSVLLVSVVTFVGRTRNSLLKQEVGAELLNRSHRMGENLRASLGTARLLMADYGGSPDFSSYRAWVRSSIATSPSDPQPAPFLAPPLVTNAREAELNSPVPGAQSYWGDELLFLATLQPLTMTVTYGSYATATAQSLSVDRVQFAYIYPALIQLNRGTMTDALRLVEWRSQPYVLYGSIKDFTNTPAAPKLTKTCEALVDAGYLWAFDLDKADTPNQAWYKISKTGASLLTLDTVGPLVAARSQWAYMDEYEEMANFKPRPGVDLGRVARVGSGGTASGPANYVLAFNTVTSTASPLYTTVELRGPGKLLAVPANGAANRGGPGFPGGLEVAIVGRPQAREVVVRHVLMGVAATDPQAKPGSRQAFESMEILAVKNDY